VGLTTAPLFDIIVQRLDFVKSIFLREDKYKVEIFTPFEYLYDIEECRPKPAKFFFPEWWKDMPLTFKKNNDNIKTAKTCPSFVQFYNQGFVIPMWCDTILRRESDNSFTWQTSTDKFSWDFHLNDQLLDYTNIKNTNSTVMKANSPWYVKTSKGVSLYQMPLFYNFNKDYTVLPGVINTEFHHEINQQVLYTSDKDEVFIKRGDPFAWYIPFERQEFNFDVRAADQKDKDNILLSGARIFTKFSGSYKRENKDRGIS
jgi:hypothetical protein